MSKLQLSSKSDQQDESAPPPPAEASPPPPPDSVSQAAGQAPTAPPPAISTPPPLPTSAPAPSATSSAGNRFLGRLLVKIVAFLIVTGVSLGWYFMTHDGASLIGSLYGADEGEAYSDDASLEGEANAAEGEITYDQRDDWPAIELMGMVAANRNSQASAILNGSLVVLNQRVEGARLVEIRSDGVVLEYERDRKFILVGEGTL